MDPLRKEYRKMGSDDVTVLVSSSMTGTFGMPLQTAADIRAEQAGTSAGWNAKGAGFDVLFCNKRPSMLYKPWAAGRPMARGRAGR